MSGSKPARDGARTAPPSGDAGRVHPDAVARAAVPSARPVMDPGTRQNPGAMTEPALLHQSCRRVAPRLQQIPALSAVLDGDASDETQRSMCLLLFGDGFLLTLSPHVTTLPKRAGRYSPDGRARRPGAVGQHRTQPGSQHWRLQCRKLTARKSSPAPPTGCAWRSRRLAATVRPPRRWASRPGR